MCSEDVHSTLSCHCPPPNVHLYIQSSKCPFVCIFPSTDHYIYFCPATVLIFFVCIVLQLTTIILSCDGPNLYVCIVLLSCYCPNLYVCIVLLSCDCPNLYVCIVLQLTTIFLSCYCPHLGWSPRGEVLNRIRFKWFQWFTVTLYKFPWLQFY